MPSTNMGNPDYEVHRFLSESRTKLDSIREDVETRTPKEHQSELMITEIVSVLLVCVDRLGAHSNLREHLLSVYNAYQRSLRGEETGGGCCQQSIEQYREECGFENCTAGRYIPLTEEEMRDILESAPMRELSGDDIEKIIYNIGQKLYGARRSEFIDLQSSRESREFRDKYLEAKKILGEIVSLWDAPADLGRMAQAIGKARSLTS